MAATAERTSEGGRRVRFRPHGVRRRAQHGTAPLVLLRTPLDHHSEEGPNLALALQARRRTVYERFVKPVIDRVAATLLLIVALPVMLVVALLVMIQLGRPVFFVQHRVGKNGIPFRMLKFRTMGPDRRGDDAPSAYSGPERRQTHKSSDDPRHTLFGRFLRRTKLDELPQLFHVISGRMSIVGPRPELARIVATKYEPWQHSRHLVHPGITGLWQVTMPDREGSMWRDTAIDLRYIVTLSFRGDMAILLRTFFRLPSIEQPVPDASTVLPSTAAALMPPEGPSITVTG